MNTLMDKPSSEREEKIQVLMGMLESFGKEYSQKTWDLVLTVLEKISIEELTVAVLNLMKTCEWMPSVAKIMAEVEKGREKDDEKIIVKIREKLEEKGLYTFGNQAWQDDVDEVLESLGYEKGRIQADRV